MKPDLVIGIDSSTSGCKAIAWDASGNVIAQGHSSHILQSPQPGMYEQSAEDWWQALCASLRQITRSNDVSRYAALCIAHQRETFVPVDENCIPLRPAILWMDERAGDLLPMLEETCAGTTFHEITGKPLSGNLTFSKIAWLREHERDLFKKTRWYLDVHAFLAQRLTGEVRTSWGSADPTGLFDMRRNTWATELLEPIGIRIEQMPEAFPPGAILGKLTREASAQTGLPEGLPVVAGIGDGQAGGLGAGIFAPGDAYLSLGSSVVGGTFSPTFTTSRAFRSMYAGISGGYMLETVILGGLFTTDWFCKEFSHVPIAELEEAIQHIPPGADGLMLVPYWCSAMNPYWDANASGITLGWRGVHTPFHFYRAILEGIAYELRLHLAGVEAALSHPVERLIAMGGGVRSPNLSQIIADVTGKPVFRTGTTEAAALGAGMLAATACGLHPDVRAASSAMTRIQPQACQPDPRNHALYSRLYENVYQHLYPALQPYLTQLNRISPTHA
jgi:sugar (pentulose or hexulose) kinase